MKKISEMSGEELRRFLKIESVVDCDIDEFDAWDDEHIGADYCMADDRRRELIRAIIHAGFVGIENYEEAERIGYSELYNINLDAEDKKAIVEELVNGETCNILFDSVIETVQLPEDDLSIDDIIKICKAELFENFKGNFIKNLSCLDKGEQHNELRRQQR